jgi:glycosyltransferase involved in cell wall biosynthesis
MNSICIATYNGEKYIHQQLSSILSQINIDDEVIISDDDSTDNTIEIIKSLNDKRIKIIHGGFHHFKWNFANALQHSKGEYIFLSDQDDIWVEGKYQACLNKLQKVDLICHNSSVVDENLNTIIPSFFDYYHSGAGIIKNSIKNTYFGACMAFNRKVLNAALPLPKTMEIGHDIWLGLVAESIGKTEFINTPYLLYRRHDTALTNISNDLKSRSKRSLFTKIWSRFVVIYHICLFNIKYLCKKH